MCYAAYYAAVKVEGRTIYKQVESSLAADPDPSPDHDFGDSTPALVCMHMLCQAPPAC